ncbi:MAG: DUF167 domain-containing protein [Acidobacteriota bacterium]
MIKFTERDGAVTFSVRVQPRASESHLVGVLDGTLKVRLAAPPVDGAANEELVKLIAGLFGVAKSKVEIRAGATGRQKVVRVYGIADGDGEKVLGAIAEAQED